MNKQLFAALCLVLMGFLAAPGTPSCQEFPDPVGYVNDFAGVMSADAVRRLDAILRELAQKTGVEVAVATVRDMGGMDENTYAVELFETWGIGSKETNNGLLILVAVQERRLRIEVGYGLEHIITDARAGQIRDNYMVPSLKNNDYDTGITTGTLAAASIIAEAEGVTLTGSMPVPQPARNRGSKPQGLIALINFIVIFIIMMTVLRMRGGGGLLTGMLLGHMLGGGHRRYYGGGGFGGGFGGGGGGGFSGFGGGFSGGGGASGGF